MAKSEFSAAVVDAFVAAYREADQMKSDPRDVLLERRQADPDRAEVFDRALELANLDLKIPWRQAVDRESRHRVRRRGHGRDGIGH